MHLLKGRRLTADSNSTVRNPLIYSIYFEATRVLRTIVV